MDYICRPYNTGDEEGIVHLLELVFDGWPHFNLSCSPLDHWKWKYLEAHNGLINIYVAEHDSLIVGSESRVPLRAKVGQEILDCEQRCDLVVHPDHRRRGIFKKIHTKLNESSLKSGVKFSYAIEGNPIVINHMKKIGVQTFNNKAKNLYWINDIDKFLKQYEKSFLYKIVLILYKLMSKIKHLRLNYSMGKKSLIIKDIHKFDERFDDFWLEVSKDYDYILIRDRAYLNWRYCDPRGGLYTIKVAEELGKILGYVVLRINRYQENYLIGNIVDVLILPERKDVLESLIEESINFFINADVDHVNCWLIRDHPYEKSLKKFSFLDLNRHILFSFLPYTINNVSFQNIIGQHRKIFLSIGDSDII